MVATLVVGLIASVTSPSADWIRVRSPRAEVLSDAGEPAARQAAARVERLLAVLERLLPAGDEDGPDGDAPLVRVILLGSRDRVQALAPAGHARPSELAGFFVSGSDGPVIVAPSPADTSPEGWRVLDHECVHLHLNRTLAAQPLWVAEGLAETLSGGDLDGPVAALGHGRPERQRLVRGHARLPLADVLGIGYDSPAYRGEGLTDVLYAKAEALVRRILARHGLAALLDFLATIAAGTEPGPAFAERFGDPAAIEPTLLETPAAPLFFVDQSSIRDLSARLVSSSPSAAEVQFRLGDVLLHGDRADEAHERFDRALDAEPGHGGARAGLARLLIRRGLWAEAERELQRALADAPDDPPALLRYAQLVLARARREGSADWPDAEAKATAALERAVALAPGLVEAVELLASEQPEPLAARLPLLRRAFARDPGRPQVGLVLSALLVKAHDVGAARTVLVRARDAARDPTYRFLCEHRLRKIRDYQSQTVEARGRLVELQCLRDGSLRFLVAAASGRLSLTAASARSLFVRGPDGAAQLQLVCGAQDVPVRVRFVPPPAPEIDGTLLTLVPELG